MVRILKAGCRNGIGIDGGQFVVAQDSLLLLGVHTLKQQLSPVSTLPIKVAKAQY